MIETVYQRLWTMGLRLRNLGKNTYLLRHLEPNLVKLAAWLIPAPRTEVSVRLPSGISVKVPPGFPAARSYSSGLYEPEITRLVETTVKPGMTFVDAGANVGYYTLIAARLVGVTGRIYAFEPDPLNYSYLLQNLETNGCRCVTTVPTALSGTTGRTRFIRDTRGAEGFVTSDRGVQNALDVPTVTLDDFFGGEGWPAIHIMKMDIEGSEKSALEGMRELSRRNPQMRLILELNTPAIVRSGNTVHDVTEVLRALGFLTAYVIEDGYRPFSIDSDLPRAQATYNLLVLKHSSGPS